MFFYSPQAKFASEVLAYQVTRLIPSVRLLGGGCHPLGFFYDFIFQQPLNENVIELLERETKNTIKSETPVRFFSMMRENAAAFLEHQKQIYLAEKAAEDPSNIVDMIEIEGFYGLSPSFDFSTTADVGSIKILQEEHFFIEGERGEERVTRLVGVVCSTPQDLKQFVKKFDKFKKRKDHRFLGPQLALYSFVSLSDFVQVSWQPKGVLLRRLLVDGIKQQWQKKGEEVQTPLLSPLAALRTSFDFFHQNILQELVSKEGQISPVIFEEGMVSREISQEERWGLLSSDVFTALQYSLSVPQEQLSTSLISLLHFIEQIITIFFFKGNWCILEPQQNKKGSFLHTSLMPLIRETVKKTCVSFPVTEKKLESEEKKIILEMRVEDELGREWILASIEVIPAVSERKGCTIFCRPVESLDRLIALLLEKTEGDLPLWLCPEQVRVLSIGEKNVQEVECVVEKLRKLGFRVTTNHSIQNLDARILEAEKEKVPYIVLIGDQERKNGEISVRSTTKSQENSRMHVEALIKKLMNESRSPNELSFDIV